MVTEAAESSTTAQDQMHEILDSCPVRPRHYALWLLSAGGTLIDGMSVAALAIALPLIKHTFTMSPLMIGAVSAASVVGMAVGAITGGRASDRIGRRHLFLISMVAITVGALGSAVAWSPELILVSQFILGCGIGSEFPNSSTYVSEIMPVRARHRMLVATITGQSVGMLVAVGLGYLFLRADPDIDTWRYFLGSRAVAAALFVVLRGLSMPESPAWLMLQGRNAEAAGAIASLAPDRRADLTELGRQSRDHRFSSADHQAGSTGLSVLFTGPYLRRTMLAAGAWFLMDISTYGVGHFAPSVLATLFTGEQGGGAIAAEFASIRGSFALDAFLLLGFLLGMWLVPRVGQIRMQGIGFIGMALGMGILVVAVGGPDAAGQSALLVLVGFSVFNLLMNMGPNSTTFGMPALLFPSEIRATAAGFSAACAKIGATLGTLFLPMISKAIGLQYTLALLACLAGAGFLITTTLGRGLLPAAGESASSATGAS
jgi:putative MFS transporter